MFEKMFENDWKFSKTGAKIVRTNSAIYQRPEINAASQSFRARPKM